MHVSVCDVNSVDGHIPPLDGISEAKRSLTYSVVSYLICTIW